LNSVMPNSPSDYFPGLRKLVVTSHCRERTAGYAVGCLKQNRTGSPFAEKLLHMIWHIMKIILRSATFQAGIFGLLNVHCFE
jgi:hypothetical protein